MNQEEPSGSTSFGGHFNSGANQWIGSNFNTRGGSIYITTSDPQPVDEFRRTLRFYIVTDPRTEKQRILNRKNSLLTGTWSWVLEDTAFQSWWQEDKYRILWIHGDPGKGKTMLAIALIEEIERRISNSSQEDNNAVLSFCFCQRSLAGQNDAIFALRSLIYLLIDQRKELRHYAAAYQDIEGERLFQDDYGLHALWRLLSEMLRDHSLPSVYLVVDALDECNIFQEDFLRLLTQESSSLGPKVKWLITSRNETQIKAVLDRNTSVGHTSLELHSQHVTEAVEAFIDHNVNLLRSQKGYDVELHNYVHNYLRENAHGTFLWVWLVCQELFKPRVPLYRTKSVLQTFPSGLALVYEGMFQQMLVYTVSDELEYIRKILRASILSFRPLHISELAKFAGLPNDCTEKEIDDLIEYCGSFLIVRDSLIYFVHQSAREFFENQHAPWIVPDGITEAHRAVTQDLMAMMFTMLKTDICNIKFPGAVIDEIDERVIACNVPRPLQYACRYWVEHFTKGSYASDADCTGSSSFNALRSFLNQHFLHWLEVLSLIRNVSEATIAFAKLEDIPVVQDTSLLSTVIDAKRFVFNNRKTLELAPLQVYSAGLVFTSRSNEVKQMYIEAHPQQLRLVGDEDERPNPCLHVLESHSGSVESICFSKDGSRMASASLDGSVVLWDTKNWTPIQSFGDHDGYVSSVSFAPDGKILASGCSDKRVRLWDTHIGGPPTVFKGQNADIEIVTFSPSGQLLASASWDGKIRLWDVIKGCLQYEIDGHSKLVESIVFSTDGAFLVSASWDGTVKIHRSVSGALEASLEHHSRVRIVDFSARDTLVSAGTDDGTVILFYLGSGSRVNLPGHNSAVRSLKFSPQETWIATGSDDTTIRVWSIESKNCNHVLQHSSRVRALDFLHDGSLLASGSNDGMIKLWETTTWSLVGTLDGHTGPITTVAFTAWDNYLVSGSWDHTIRVWEYQIASVDNRSQKHHAAAVDVMAVSPDGTVVASGSQDTTVKIWSLRSAELLCTFTGHRQPIKMLHFSQNGSVIVSVSFDNMICVWPIIVLRQSFETAQTRWVASAMMDSVDDVQLSLDGRLVFIRYESGRIKLIDTWEGLDVWSMLDIWHGLDVWQKFDVWQTLDAHQRLHIWKRLDIMAKCPITNVDVSTPDGFWTIAYTTRTCPIASDSFIELRHVTLSSKILLERMKTEEGVAGERDFMQEAYGQRSTARRRPLVEDYKWYIKERFALFGLPLNETCSLMFNDQEIFVTAYAIKIQNGQAQFVAERHVQSPFTEIVDYHDPASEYHPIGKFSPFTWLGDSHMRFRNTLTNREWFQQSVDGRGIHVQKTYGHVWHKLSGDDQAWYRPIGDDQVHFVKELVNQAWLVTVLDDNMRYKPRADGQAWYPLTRDGQERFSLSQMEEEDVISREIRMRRCYERNGSSESSWGLNKSKSWLTFDGTRQLRLPVEMVASVHCSVSDNIVLGTGSGRLFFLKVGNRPQH